MSDYRDQVFPGQAGPSRLRRIVLEFESFRDFIQAFSPLVSDEGMFVASEFLPEGLPSMGEEVSFEVRLTDDFRLVQGRGDVVRVAEAAGREGAAGVAVRFLDLDEPSRRLVSRLVNNYTKDGGEPFLLGAQETKGDDAVEPELLARSEADELFSHDVDGASPDRQELDSMVPETDERVLEEPSAMGLEHGEDDDLPALLDIEVPALPDIDGEGVMPDLDLDLDLDLETDALDVPVDVEIGLAGLEETAQLDEPLMPEAPAPVISEDIAQVAEELSGIHHVEPVEMPLEEDQREFAGAASAKPTRSPWVTLAIASLAGIALGVAAWFYAGDRLKTWIGLGDGEPTIIATETEAPMPTPETELMAESAVGEAVPGESQQVETSSEAGPVSVAEPAGADEPQTPVPASPRESEAPAEERAAEARAAAAPAAASRIERITWDEGAGETIVRISLDGAITDSSYEVVRIREGAPRELIKIFGVSRPFSPNQLAVGTAQLERLRTGLHDSGGRSAIHIVADLTGPAAAITLVRVEGNDLLLTFS